MDGLRVVVPDLSPWCIRSNASLICPPSVSADAQAMQRHLGQRQHVRDELVYLHLALKVSVHQLRHLLAALPACENVRKCEGKGTKMDGKPPNADPFHTRPVTSWNGRVEISAPPSPMTACALEHTLAGRGDADDDRLAPALVAGLQRRTLHGLSARTWSHRMQTMVSTRPMHSNV